MRPRRARIKAPLEGTELTAVFRLKKVGGSSGCNTYDGPYTTNGSVAAIGPLATTRMACADDVMAQETAFLKALQGVGKIELRAQTVLLQDLGGQPVGRPAAAGSRGGRLPESLCGRLGQPGPDTDARDAEPQPHALSEPDADRDPDTHSDPDPDSDPAGDGGTDRQTAAVRATDRDLHPDDAVAGHGLGDGRLPRELAHRDGSADGSVSVLRSRGDHRPGRSLDAHDRRDDQVGPRRHLRRGPGRRDQPDRVERAHQQAGHGRRVLPATQIEATSTAGSPGRPGGIDPLWLSHQRRASPSGSRRSGRSATRRTPRTSRWST